MPVALMLMLMLVLMLVFRRGSLREDETMYATERFNATLAVSEAHVLFHDGNELAHGL